MTFKAFVKKEGDKLRDGIQIIKNGYKDYGNKNLPNQNPVSLKRVLPEEKPYMSSKPIVPKFLSMNAIKML